MIVCHCEVINDRAVAEAIAAGASSIDDVAGSCGAGASCAGCHDTIEDMLDATGRKVHLAAR